MTPAVPPPLPYVAQLRVYEPLTAFDPDERERWAAYVTRGEVPDPAAGLAAEHRSALVALLAAPPRVGPVAAEPEHAFVRRQAGQIYVCPWRTGLRARLALVEFRSGMPEELAAAFLPPAVAETAENELEKEVAAHPERRPHIRSSTWHVPLAWFCLFEPAERELMLGRGAGRARRGGVPPGDPPGDRGLPRRSRYLATMAQARRRSARTLATLRRAVADGSMAGRVEDVARWLEEFHPHALVELDYGGLVDLMTDEELRGDDTPAGLALALRQLADGDVEAAGETFDRVAERWRRLRGLESAN